MNGLSSEYLFIKVFLMIMNNLMGLLIRKAYLCRSVLNASSVKTYYKRGSVINRKFFLVFNLLGKCTGIYMIKIKRQVIIYLKYSFDKKILNSSGIYKILFITSCYERS